MSAVVAPRADQVRLGLIKVEPYYGIPTRHLVAVMDQAARYPSLLRQWDFRNKAHFRRFLSNPSRAYDRSLLLVMYREAVAFLSTRVDKQNRL